MATLKEWKVDTRRDKCDCSQHIDLEVTGNSADQGPVKYCPVCRIGFWEHMITPTPMQVLEAQKINMYITSQMMQYPVLRREPKPSYKGTEESIMIDQLGGKTQMWMSHESKKYWLKKYCEKYPNSVIALNVKKRLEKDE